MKHLILILLFPTISYADCINKISVPNAQKAIEQTLPANAALCPKGETCVCFDHVTDWTVMELKSGQIVVSNAKKSAKDTEKEQKQAALEAKKRAKADRKEFLKLYKGKNLSDAELRDAVSMLIDSHVEQESSND